MKINKQLFKDVLSGKLKGTFIRRDGNKIPSSELEYTNEYTFPIYLMGCGYTYQGRFVLTPRKNNFDIVDFIPDMNMKENELTIEIPQGKIVDWEESKKQNKIVLKDKQLTYKDICGALYKDKTVYYTDVNGGIVNMPFSELTEDTPYDSNNASTKHQLECILAKNKLANVAVYLNDGWKPNKGDHVFTIMYYGDFKDKLIISEHYFGTGENLILFRTQKDAKQAIEILGEETVKLALEPLGI